MKLEIQWLLLALVLYLVILLYLRIAGHFGVIDHPGTRRSHHTATIRGGGIVFLLAAIWSWVAGAIPTVVWAGWILCGLSGLLDDWVRVKPVYRLVLQLAALYLMLLGFDVPGIGLWAYMLILFLGVAWVNAFNFMDGINGMLAINTAVSLLTFWMMPELGEYRDAMLFVGIGVLVFAFFNVRTNARVFAGDVGSMTGAFFLGALMCYAILVTGEISYLLFFSVYGIDTAGTIILRLLNRENIFTPHRMHLYQLLANEHGVPHLLVAGGYAGVQLGINLLVLPLIQGGKLGFMEFLLIVVGMSIVYLFFRTKTVQTGHKSI